VVRVAENASPRIAIRGLLGEGSSELACVQIVQKRTISLLMRSISRSIPVLLALAILMVFAARAWADGQPGSDSNRADVTLVAVDSNGNPVVNVTAVLGTQGGNVAPILQGTTDRNGTCVFHGVKPGDYFVGIDTGDNHVFGQKLHVDPSKDKNPTVNVTLPPKQN
jgi:hypothetical protein